MPPPDFAHQVRHWLDQEFPEAWIGRGGPVTWAARSPDLNPLDFSIWGYLKHKVYAQRIRDRGHLRARIRRSVKICKSRCCKISRPIWKRDWNCVWMLVECILNIYCEYGFYVTALFTDKKQRTLPINQNTNCAFYAFFQIMKLA